MCKSDIIAIKTNNIYDHDDLTFSSEFTTEQRSFQIFISSSSFGILVLLSCPQEYERIALIICEC
jgi:hypothetical protein